MADEVRGLAIAKAMKKQEQGFINYKVKLKMVLINTAGKETIRRLHVKNLEVKNDGDKSLAVFDAPADVKGTAFLSHTHITKDDDQWLYLPSLKRVKRISPTNKTAPFMGSEFSYEDLASVEVEKYKYKYIGSELLNKRKVFILERYPLDANTGYSRHVVWVDQKRYIPLKTEFYDRKKRKLKTMVFENYKKYLNRFWRAGKARMDNHQSGKSSVLFWQDYQFRKKIGKQDFHPSSLKRIR